MAFTRVKEASGLIPLLYFEKGRRCKHLFDPSPILLLLCAAVEGIDICVRFSIEWIGTGLTIVSHFLPGCVGGFIGGLRVNEPSPPVTVALRIPGQWSHPRDLIERLPAGCRLTAEALILPDATEVGFGAARADDQFASIFRSSCRQPPTEDELAMVDGYTVNVFLSGPGGSMPAARTMMQAAAAVVRAGGAGVFIDNSAMAHGGRCWLEMTEDGSPDALSFAFVGVVRGRTEVRTMGMHVLGLRDVVMKRTDIEERGFDIVDVIRYLARGEKPIGDGHVIGDENGPHFRVFTQDSAAEGAGTPMQNPFGRLKLVSMGDIAEAN